MFGCVYIKSLNKFKKKVGAEHRVTGRFRWLHFTRYHSKELYWQR